MNMDETMNQTRMVKTTTKLNFLMSGSLPPSTGNRRQMVGNHNTLQFAMLVLLCLGLTACGSKKSNPPQAPVCEGAQVLNAEQTACIEQADCIGSGAAISANPNSIRGGVCITDTACRLLNQHVATDTGTCEACSGDTPHTNAEKTACGVDDDQDGTFNGDDAFPNDACASVDSDGDGAPDALVDSCTTSLRTDACASGAGGAPTTGDATAANADPDNDGCKNSEDVDDDNDGLIEIATAEELDNMRHDLAGHSYDDEADDSTTATAGDTTGAPSAPTTLCPDETSASSGIYLCGYEFTADIDFFGSDGASGGGDDIDRSSTTAGNFDPIGNDGDGSTGDFFTARLHGNGHTISNLAIDITGTSVADADDHTNDAALIGSCRGSIQDITLANPQITGRRRGGALCANAVTSVAVIRNAHVSNGAISGDSAFTFLLYIGGLVGFLDNGSQIIGSSSSGSVSNGGTKGDRMGGLVGQANTALIIGSSSSGAVSNGGGGHDSMGGLVGLAQRATQIIGSSSSGAVSNGGTGSDIMGGLVGQAHTTVIIGSSSSGSVSNGGGGDERMGGLAGQSYYGIVRDSFSSASVCDGTTSTTFCDNAGNGTDGVGVLIGWFYGRDAGGGTELHNSLGTGQTKGSAGDNIGFLGRILSGDQSQINAELSGNRFDTESSKVADKAGRVPTWDHDDNGGTDPVDVTIGDALIVGGITSATKALTAVSTGWSAARWLFASGQYPRPIYFDYDQDMDGDDDPTTKPEDVIDVCEEISDSDSSVDGTAGNDPMLDEGCRSPRLRRRTGGFPAMIS